ncbi:MAG: cupin domain-containing protein [Coriobacteriales bacterium]|jgi:transcriptional regulator with XRE-family HTH domain|nr:cupin domain-containing protein [Coriobacteriales bacterium]
MYKADNTATTDAAFEATALGATVLQDPQAAIKAPKGSVGTKITELREALLLSPEQLAERCACDVSVIKNLEAGELAPSLAPLIKITRALGVRLGTLLDDDEALGPVLTRANSYKDSTRLKGLETHSDAGELTFQALAEGKAARHMEPFFITLEPSEDREHTLSAHEGEEWLYALEGPLEIEYGKELYILQPGDSIYYDSIVPHQVRSHNGQPAAFVACVYTPV